jgi:hypothetical protein
MILPVWAGFLALVLFALLSVVVLFFLLEGVIRIVYLFTSEKPPPLFKRK